MKWKQFFTPVKSITASEAKDYMANVRQPREYEDYHIPGAKLIPIPELDKRLNEIDSHKPVLVYCAIGGRSRVAAQMLAGKGFNQVINMAGGIKAWDSHLAVGSEEQGLELLTGNETVEETLIIAYSLEAGLRDFYLSMIEKVKDHEVKSLFQKLSEIEVKHQDRIFAEYLQTTGKSIGRSEFESNTVKNAVEGGFTTEQYMEMFKPDWESAADITSLAMSIEAQALDLYSRGAARSKDARSKSSLKKIAEEERSHLEQLGKLMDSL